MATTPTLINEMEPRLPGLMDACRLYRGAVAATQSLEHAQSPHRALLLSFTDQPDTDDGPFVYADVVDLTLENEGQNLDDEDDRQDLVVGDARHDDTDRMAFDPLYTWARENGCARVLDRAVILDASDAARALDEAASMVDGFMSAVGLEGTRG